MLVGDKPLSEAAVFSGAGSNSLLIDTTRLTFACPLDLAGIVASAQSAASHSIAVELRLPADLSMAAYLQRMDVIRQMPPRTKVVGRLPADARADQAKRLVEVTALSERNMDTQAEKLGPVITEFYAEYADAGGAAVFKACSELMGNATEHGASERGSFFALQLYTGTTTECPRLEFAVCDTGIGVMRHLRRNPRYEHLTRDELAIVRAFDRGVSGVGGDRRGNGLYDAVEEARQFGQVDVHIRSGRGDVRISADPSDRSATIHDRPDQTDGTWAWLTHRLGA